MNATTNDQPPAPEVRRATNTFVDVELAEAEREALHRLRITRPSSVPTVQRFQQFRDTEFVPYEVDSLAEADRLAMRAFAEKYPGAILALETFKGMRNQFLKAS